MTFDEEVRKGNVNTIIKTLRLQNRVLRERIADLEKTNMNLRRELNIARYRLDAVINDNVSMAAMIGYLTTMIKDRRIKWHYLVSDRYLRKRWNNDEGDVD